VQEILDEHAKNSHQNSHRTLREITEGLAEAGNDRPPPSVMRSRFTRFGTMANLEQAALEPNNNACWCMPPTHCLRRACIAVVKSRCVSLSLSVCVCVLWLQRVVNLCVIGLCVLLDCVCFCVRARALQYAAVTLMFLPL